MKWSGNLLKILSSFQIGESTMDQKTTNNLINCSIDQMNMWLNLNTGLNKVD